MVPVMKVIMYDAAAAAAADDDDDPRWIIRLLSPPSPACQAHYQRTGKGKVSRPEPNNRQVRFCNL